MKIRNPIQKTALAVAIASVSILANAQDVTLYESHVLPEALIFEPNSTIGMNSDIEIVVKGPNGLVLRQNFQAGDAIEFNPATIAQNGLPDGTYRYELQIVAIKGVSAQRGPVGIADAVQNIPQPGFGTFAVLDGKLISPETEEPAYTAAETGRPGPNAIQLTADDSDQQTRDQVIIDDLIVDGSACIGQDCVNGENFGFDTLRLKENNLRIKFDDTSNSGSFPNNDWQLTANESANGGLNKFSIDNTTTGRTPFLIEGPAPSNSLYIDDAGNIGIGTSIPVLEAHIVDGDSPALRLQQDGSSGFTAQTFDIAANETNFFIRDVTNGSQLPFKIKPGADDNSLFIAANNNIGMGTASPAGAMHIRRSGNVIPLIESSDNSAVQLRFKSDNPNRRFLAVNSADEVETQIEFGDGIVKFFGATAADNLMEVDATSLRVNGAIVSNGTTLNVPDYVFQDDYPLMTIGELKQFIGENSHLPNVPSAADVKENGLNHTQFQLNLLEKVEELTLYTIQQQELIDRQVEAIAELEKRLDNIN